MPLPKPHKKDGKKEKQSDFMSRCMTDENVKKDFKTHDQRVAVCLNLYSEKAKGELDFVTDVQDSDDQD